MTRGILRSSRLRMTRKQLAFRGLLVGLSATLITRPDLWQYLTAILLVHDLLMRVHGSERNATEDGTTRQTNGKELP
ncbi:hypothetical protein SRB5_52270 [Streptomyces sp. RB5]|uniref:Uncharacterized protein n=1 Tax=Streptomyces smaragdinus TaxID=2585196 RepID=A0A7K0CNJ1_9ACTN|nr:hypothetical protein [Streptomyces smaragdinus]